MTRSIAPLFETLEREETSISTDVVTVPVAVWTGLTQVLTAISEQNRALMEQQETHARMLAELQRQVSYSIPLTSTQEKMLKGSIAAKANALLDRQGVTSKKAINRLASIIRKDTKTYFSVKNLRDISKADYPVAVEYVRKWMDVRKIMECGKVN